MARQVALTLPKAVLELCRPGTDLAPQWELIYLAMTQARVAGRTALADELQAWLGRIQELTRMKNELIHYERVKSLQISPGGNDRHSGRGAKSTEAG